jgi:hypothetical protein
VASVTDAEREALAVEIEAMFVAVTKEYTATRTQKWSTVSRRHLHLLIIGAAKGYNVLEFVRAFNRMKP